MISRSMREEKDDIPLSKHIVLPCSVLAFTFKMATAVENMSVKPPVRPTTFQSRLPTRF